MDTLTQAALGAAVAQAGFAKRLGGKAVVAGALLGVLPDVDIISSAFGPWASMVHHRGITHSLLFAPLMAPVLGWVLWRLNKRHDQWWRWGHLAFWALITHPLLDLFTSYGTQLFAPLSDRRLVIDAVAIIDPIYTLLLVGALVIARVWRRRPTLGRYAAVSALVLSTGYLFWGWAESHRARKWAVAQLREQGFEPAHVRAQPSLFIWLWRIVARDGSGDLRVAVVSTYRPTVMNFTALERPPDPLVDQALASERGQLFAWFSDRMIGVRLVPSGGGTRVYLDDQRYGLVTEPARAFWGAYAHFDANGRLTAFERYQWHPTGRLGQALAASWRMMWQGVPPP